MHMVDSSAVGELRARQRNSSVVGELVEEVNIGSWTEMTGRTGH